jgi:hypothetical protein
MWGTPVELNAIAVSYPTITFPPPSTVCVCQFGAAALAVLKLGIKHEKQINIEKTDMQSNLSFVLLTNKFSPQNLVSPLP